MVVQAGRVRAGWVEIHDEVMRGLEGIATPSWDMHKKLRSCFLVHIQNRLMSQGIPPSLSVG